MGFTLQKTGPAKHLNSKGLRDIGGFLPSEEKSLGSVRGKEREERGLDRRAGSRAGRRESAAPPADRLREGGRGWQRRSRTAGLQPLSRGHGP